MKKLERLDFPNENNFFAIENLKEGITVEKIGVQGFVIKGPFLKEERKEKYIKTLERQFNNCSEGESIKETTYRIEEMDGLVTNLKPAYQTIEWREENFKNYDEKNKILLRVGL